jgi:hypothetical protein
MARVLARVGSARDAPAGSPGPQSRESRLPPAWLARTVAAARGSWTVVDTMSLRWRHYRLNRPWRGQVAQATRPPTGPWQASVDGDRQVTAYSAAAFYWSPPQIEDWRELATSHHIVNRVIWVEAIAHSLAGLQVSGRVGRGGAPRLDRRSRTLPMGMAYAARGFGSASFR